MTRVAILWHMHQPFYEDLVTHEHILPWVRLHALKDYYGMVALLREFPGVKATFNLVPSLLVQLEDFAADRAHDRFLELSLKPANDLTEGDIDFMLDNFFHAQRERMIDVYPRYAELLARRGGTLLTAADRRAAAGRFTRDDLRDLQVWHKLAWIDPLYLDGDARVRALVGKGSQFTEPDKLVLREVELEILNRVIPEYRDAAARGQIELSASPFYHPILPLLCDTDIYLRTHPDSRMPRRRFIHPEDAREQLRRAADCHERLFGQRPVGLWPSEGSVSDAMLPLVVEAGFRWMATDEMILARTLNTTFGRDNYGHLEQPERLYTSYAVGQGDHQVACAFRDHVLSDLIGFAYSGWDAEAAASDFVGRLAEAGHRLGERNGGEEAFIPVILDGENAWEHFPGGGRPFLRALYRQLASHPDLTTVTMAEACAAPRQKLPSIFPGSWIDANFYIWIGHADDQRAWSQLADARDVLAEAERAGTVSPVAFAQAREEVLVAEGSDWFWWYGDDHSSAHDEEFDDLFRRHLRNVYRLLERPVPDELFISNISTMSTAPAQVDPSGFIAPTLDGEETSYFEWLGSGSCETRDAAGAMHQIDRRASVVTLVQFGFDRERLYIRIDTTRPAADLLAEGLEFTVKFLKPAAALSIRAGRNLLPPGARVVVGTIVELAVPLTVFGARPGEVLSFAVAVQDAGGSELERHPLQRAIEAAVPDAEFLARNWSA